MRATRTILTALASLTCGRVDSLKDHLLIASFEYSAVVECTHVVVGFVRCVVDGGDYGSG